MTLAVSGLPGSAAAAVSISGPGSYSLNATGSATIQNLNPGSYTISAASVVVGGLSYSGSPTTQSVNVIAGQTTVATVTYAPQAISVRVDPSSANLLTGGTQSFTATVSNASNQAVTWSVDGTGSGTITAAGTYTAPAAAGAFTVRATSDADATKSGTANITVTAPTGITIALSPTAPNLGVGGMVVFSATVTGSSNQNATWTVISGSAAGSIPAGPSATATFTAGSTAGSCQVKATSMADPTKTATAMVTITAAGPVITTHPRLLFSEAGKSRLLAKKNAGDPSWLALKARADTFATYTINPYKSASSSAAPPGTIYYTYQGEGWLAAALPLAFAYQMTADAKYSGKLIELAQEMIRAQSDPDNNPPSGLPPIRLDSYYASRTVASTLAFIYDYCYDQLSAPLKAQMVTLMNQYFDDVRINGYQAQNYSNAADGNYFGGHLYGVALMGYASFGDNARAQEMIEWARLRFDGRPGSTLPPSATPLAWRTQVFDGGLSPASALDFNGPAVTGNPFKGGFDFQGWSYGSEEFSRMIDYMQVVKSATGEDLFAPHADWFPQILRGAKQALFPNRFMIDPTGDWGGFQGAVISRGLPTRLAFVLAGTPDGPGAQHFVQTEIAASTLPGAEVFPAEEWAEFYFGDPARPSTELPLPPYHTGFGPNYPQGATSPGGTNGAIPYFIMRSDWSANATWASVQMGSQWWDDHQHYAAGHVVITRGGDYLLV
ncbi:MAG: Ig-like domain-containing protein, partial [Acidobacteriota bacterium]|nr:Ig-like domain-containing protein [Acidobacteriota bacterium]